MGDVLAAYNTRVDGRHLSADEAQASAAVRLDALAQDLAQWNPDAWFNRKPAPRGVYLWGAVGRGKSMLMDLFFDHAPINKKTRVHFHAFMRAQHAFLKKARARIDGPERGPLLARAAKRVAANARLLCFDEFAVSDIADALILGPIFKALLDEDVVIVATSNRPPRDLYKNGLNRQLFLPFIDLLVQRFDIIELAAQRDYRLERLMAAPVYYCPLGPAADAALEEAWSRLTLGAKPMPMSLDVDGRVLALERTAAGCVRTRFQDLCGRALGPSDYLEIARHFHTVLIEGVPKLSPALREEAARFRLLVDALYEARTKLVCSAEAEPHKLYPEGDQSFEFERTASRLMEMRSHAYLASKRPAETPDLD
jgi:cell division protein ZapE